MSGTLHLAALYSLVLLIGGKEENDNDNEFFTDDFPYPRHVEKRKVYKQVVREVNTNNHQAAWDKFFDRHSDGFFRDRHYLMMEFPTLKAAITLGCSKRIVELGCGTGATALPLMELFPDMITSYVGVDSSSSALSLLATHRDKRIQIVEASMCSHHLLSTANILGAGAFDSLLLIFALSAVAPIDMSICAQNAMKLLRPGGIVCFRDYAWGDLAQSRFYPSQRKGRGWYVRQDSTFSFFFTEAGVIRLFVNAGFQVLFVRTLCKTIENRGENLTMKRMWISAEFKKPVG